MTNDSAPEELEKSAKKIYESHISARQTALDVAREAARLTIPSLLPPDGSDSTSRLDSPYQSMGAYGVNNLASKLLMALYPPGSNFFRYVLPEDVQEEAVAQLQAEERTKLQARLSSIENRVLQRFETSVVRPYKAEQILHLIVAGNVLTRFDTLEKFRLYRLDQYVVCRDASGNPLEAATKESVPVSSLDAETREVCKIKPKSKQVDVYTGICWEDGRCRWWQEINGVTVPDSEGDSPADVSPWNVHRWKAVPGSDYGRGHVEEYLGALTTYEGLQQASTEFAAIAAKVVFLVHSGSTTNVADVNRARSGDAVTGAKDDIDVLQLDKYADFRVVETAISRLETLLAQAFLIRSGMTRDAERVTAEEVRAVAQELEDTLGGVYTVQAREDQLPFTRRLLHVLTSSRDIPRLPPNAAEPVIVTGFQALGRNHSLNKLRGAISDLVNIFGNEGAMKILNGTGVAARVFQGWGVEDAAGVVKTPDEIAQDNAEAQRAQMLETLVKQGVGPAINAGAKSGMQIPQAQ